jgi:hypothetical protein
VVSHKVQQAPHPRESRGGLASVWWTIWTEWTKWTGSVHFVHDVHDVHPVRSYLIHTVWIFTNSRIPNSDSSRP